MSNISKIITQFEKIASTPVLKLGKTTSAEPSNIEKALGSLYFDKDPIFNVIDKYLPEGSISIDIYMTVMPNGAVKLTVKGNHPAAPKIEQGLNATLAKKMSSILQQKKVLPAGKLEVPDVGKPWLKGIGY